MRDFISKYQYINRPNDEKPPTENAYWVKQLNFNLVGMYQSLLHALHILNQKPTEKLINKQNQSESKRNQKQTVGSSKSARMAKRPYFMLHKTKYRTSGNSIFIVFALCYASVLFLVTKLIIFNILSHFVHIRKSNATITPTLCFFTLCGGTFIIRCAREIYNLIPFAQLTKGQLDRYCNKREFNLIRIINHLLRSDLIAAQYSSVARGRRRKNTRTE